MNDSVRVLPTDRLSNLLPGVAVGSESRCDLGAMNPTLRSHQCTPTRTPQAPQDLDFLFQGITHVVEFTRLGRLNAEDHGFPQIHPLIKGDGCLLTNRLMNLDDPAGGVLLLLGVIRDSAQELFHIKGHFLDVLFHGLVSKRVMPSGIHNMETLDQPLKILSVQGHETFGTGFESCRSMKVIVDSSTPDSFLMG